MAKKLASWMAEERGGMGLSLDAEWAKPLSALHDNGKWTERHVLKKVWHDCFPCAHDDVARYS